MAGEIGLGVDAGGNPVIDPTKNVLDLVRALETTNEKLRAADQLRHDDLRAAEQRYNEASRIHQLTYSAAIREAEMRRIDQLAGLRVEYEDKITEVQRKATENTSALLAMQLRDVKAELDVRMAKMEQFRWESGGRIGGQAQIISWGIAAASVTFAIAVFALK